jgi:hypothetical protein
MPVTTLHEAGQCGCGVRQGGGGMAGTGTATWMSLGVMTASYLRSIGTVVMSRPAPDDHIPGLEHGHADDHPRCTGTVS